MKEISSQSGNAFLYVLIAVVLFAALSFVMGRQTSDVSEAGALSAERAQMAATELLAYSASVKSAIEQMTFTGSLPENLTFEKPADAGYATAPHINKVYHPEGGGIVDKPIPTEIMGPVSGSPAAGWYLGRFNNIEWTKTTKPDILLTAYQISKSVCEKINEKITGATTIPVLGASARSLLIDAASYGGSNADLTAADCAACEGFPSLCVKDNAQEIYAYYSIIVDR